MMVRSLKTIFITLVCLICFGALVPASLAGGWVVITVEYLPDQIQAGQDVGLTFWVRQHGQTPTHGVNPVVVGRNAESGEQIRVEATKEKTLGLYGATLNFPSPGEWQWSISAEPFSQTFEMAPLSVLPAGSIPAASDEQPAVPGTQPAVENLRITMQVGGLALIGVAILLALRDRRQKRDEVVPVSGD